MPVERLAEVIAATHEAAAEAQLEACCWGHAGDGNVHSSFLFDGGDAAASLRAAAAAERVFDAAVSLGRHGHRRARDRARQVGAAVQAAVARRRSTCTARSSALFDPKNLLNRGKKVA